MLILRLERVSSQYSKTPDIAWLKVSDDRIFSFFCEFTSIRERPCLRLKTPLAVVTASGHEEGHPHAGTVRYVMIYDGTVEHVGNLYEKIAV